MFGWSGGSSGQTFNPMNGGEGGTFNPDGGDRAPFNPQGGSWADNGAWPNWYPPQGASGQTFYPGSYWNGGGGGAQGGMFYPGAMRPIYPGNQGEQGGQGGTWDDQQQQDQDGGTFVPAVRENPYSPPQNKI